MIRLPLRDTDKAEKWLLAELDKAQPDATRRRLTLLLDTLHRYQWTAEEFAKWWAIDRPGQKP